MSLVLENIVSCAFTNVFSQLPCSSCLRFFYFVHFQNLFYYIIGVRSLANASRARQFNTLNPPWVGWVPLPQTHGSRGRSCAVVRAWSVMRGRAWWCVVVRGRSCVVMHGRARSCVVGHAWSCVVVRGRAWSCAVGRALSCVVVRAWSVIRGRARSVVRGRAVLPASRPALP